MNDDEEHVASGVSVSLTLLLIAGLSEQRPTRSVTRYGPTAPAQIRRQYDDGSLGEHDTVDSETYIVDLPTYNTDSEQLRPAG